MTNKKLYKIILQGLFFLVLISPLVVDRRLFFPYVTGSALYFRLIVELLLVLWVIFILVYPKYRIKFNFLFGALTVYASALILATIFSVNPYFSFWGDTERMMGLFGILHFFALFLIGVSLFREKKDLRNLIIAFSGVSFLTAVYGILQKFGYTDITPGATRITATLGNSAILASYLIFGLFFSTYIALTEINFKAKIVFYFSILIHLFAILLTGTRGAYLGVLAGFLFFSAVKIYQTDRKLRKKIIVGLAAVFVIYVFIFINKNADWVKGNIYLYRLTQFSLKDSTIQTRLMSWQWGINGFKEKPILGYGYENYAIPFNKYFEARYYNYDSNQPYFDRAHNVIVEHLVATGIIGLLSYILLLSAIIWGIIKIFKRDKNYLYLGIFGGLLAAYFVQNLFVFDTLPAMLGFCVLLIIVNNNFDSEEKKEKEIKRGKRRLLIYLPVGLILFSILIYSYKNFISKPYKAFKDEIAGEVYLPHDHDKAMEYFRKTTSYGTPYDMDLRAEIGFVIHKYYLDGNANEKRKEDLEFAIDVYKKNIEEMPGDTYYLYKLSDIMNYYAEVSDNKEAVLDEARNYIEKAIASSPNRPRLYYLMAENYYVAGDFKKAKEASQKAIDLNKEFGESYWLMAKILLENKEEEAARESIIKMYDLGYIIKESTLLGLMDVFKVMESAENEIQFLELLVKSGTKNYLFYSTLANRYYSTGRYAEAIKMAEQAVVLNPDIKEEVDGFIEEARKFTN